MDGIAPPSCGSKVRLSIARVIGLGQSLKFFLMIALVLKTDSTWQSGHTPIMRNGIYYGEDYDARLELKAGHGVEVLDFETNISTP